MQGVVLMPENPQQGSPPPNNTIVTEMEVSSDPSTQHHPTKDHHQSTDLNSHPNDSGIYSTTVTDTTMESSTSSERPDEDDVERKYVCPICNTIQTSQHDFTLHIRSHNNVDGEPPDGTHTCRICMKVLSSSSSLDRHVLVHSGERPFHCRYCGDTFTTNGNMHRHMRTHSQKGYDSDASTDSSKSTEYNNNRVELKIGAKRKSDAEHELRASKPENSATILDNRQTFKCPLCERCDFDSLNVLETHLEDNHPDYPSKCNRCNRIFPNNKLLVTHRATCHESTTPKHSVVGFKDLTFVDFSSEKFPHIARYECEKNLHKSTGNLRFQCTKCARNFPCSSSLEIHESDCMVKAESGELDLRAQNVTEKEIKRSEFFSRLNLQDNSPEKPPSSPNLIESMASTKLRQQLLAKAIAMESSTKDLADIQTIISMTTSDSLLHQLQAKSEEITRTGIDGDNSMETAKTEQDEEEEAQDAFTFEFRKMKLRGEFPCRLCTAVFPNLRALKGHNRSHVSNNTSGVYLCNMCPYSTVDKGTILRHMRSHNGDRPYECAICNYAFTTKANCERHLRNRHAKTTKEEVKQALIYHPSEDPTNDEQNKLNRDDAKKRPSSNHDSQESINDVSTPKPENLENLLPKLNENFMKHTNTFQNINELIRNENLKSLKEHRHNGQMPPYFPPLVNFTPNILNASTPQKLSSKIQVRKLETLKETIYGSSSESESSEPEPEVLDLSKKKENKQQDEEEEPQDLTKKSAELNSDVNAQHLLKLPKFDPATFYVTQLARNGFGNFSNWPNFPINPLLFPSLQNAVLPSDEIKERLQRFQMSGNNLIADTFAERLRSLQNQVIRNPNFPFPNFKIDSKTDSSQDSSFNQPTKDETKPLNLNVDNLFGDKLQPNTKPETLVQSPNSVKMVIKNGVLMPKQKQRRYRTERPFTCEHCSARFTLRSNMERHIKQQHPQFWSQRQRGNNLQTGRKTHPLPKSNVCDLNVPNFEMPKLPHYDDSGNNKEQLNGKLKFAILAQHLRTTPIKKEDDDDNPLVIDENEQDKTDSRNQRVMECEEKMSKVKVEDKLVKNEDTPDLVSVSRLLDNACQQQFKDYFKREGEETETGVVSEEDEEGLVASGSTSEGNVSGTDENKISRSESETTVPVKKRSAYSMAPNRVSCPFCSRKFPWSSSLRRHILTHTGQKPFKCSHCPLLFTTKSNCDRHLLRKHGSTATTITNEAQLNASNGYLMRNVPERPYKCVTCPSSTFSTYTNLKKHMNCKHAEEKGAQGYEAGSSEDEKTSSSDAQEVATQSGAVATADLPFKCHLCDGSFGERQDALDHIRERHPTEHELLMAKNALDGTDDATAIHNEHDDGDEMRGKFPDYSNRKVVCAFCMRRFWSAEDLRRHMRTHTGERPFSCDICRRRFTLKHSMLRHRKKHAFDGTDNVNSDEDNNGACIQRRRMGTGNDGNGAKEDSEGNEDGGDLIGNLLGIGDRSFIDKVLTSSPDDAAQLLGVKNGVKE